MRPDHSALAMHMKWPQLGDRTAATLLLVLIAFALSVTGALSRIDNVIYDTAQRYAEHDIPSDIVLVTIDEQSLSSLGRWPWSRRIHAQVIYRLHAAGAKVIGLDVMFSEPQSDDAYADRMLADAIGRAGQVVLPVVIENVRRNGQLIETLPLPALAAKAAAMGRVHAELDADAIARSMTLWEGVEYPVWPHFSQAMLMVAKQLPSSLLAQAPQNLGSSAGGLVKHDQRYINFSTNRHHLPSLSYVQVLNGAFSPGTFDGKLVFVGSTATGMADSLPTPVSGYQQPMPGVEFLANALISMRDNTLVTLSPLWLSVFLSCVLAALPMLWLPHVRTRTGLLTNTLFATAAVAVCMALPVLMHVWIPLSAGILGLLSAYPVWAWRKLESASQFLDAELIRLQQELTYANAATQPVASIAGYTKTDPFQRRIEQVRAAAAQLQLLEQAQRETLAFISHDIRVPLASAAAQVKQDLGEHHPAHKQLTRALLWTEDYLQTARVQMLTSDAFGELDVIALLHEAADEIYPLVQANSLQLALDLPDHPVWITGHFDTLSRAIANLLSNALKFSPLHGVIHVSAKPLNGQVHICITDHGAGIAQQDMDRIFQRFSRLEPTVTRSQSGIGLGLYFVQTTVQKHAGEVKVTSQPGHTTFTVLLPTSYTEIVQDET
jgi:CHASE2 domain-containing sensor protein/nitrogen-specific signal transduction histidine kinase